MIKVFMLPKLLRNGGGGGAGLASSSLVYLCEEVCPLMARAISGFYANCRHKDHKLN